MKKKNNPYTVEAEGESYGQAAATTDIYGGSFTAGESVEYESSVTPEVGEYVVISDQERESTLEPEVDRQQETVSDGGDNASMLYEQRQRQYLNGRYATRTITDNEGNVIISEGMMIDDGVIDEAKSKDKLIELVMNNKA